METEQSLQSWRKDLLFYAADKNKTESKFKFQGQSARSQLWFDLDFDWIEINFSSREPDFYKKLFQSHGDTQDNNTFKNFKYQLKMQNVQNHLSFKMTPQFSSIVKKTLNGCCFSNLASAFASINHFNAANDISKRIE